MSGGDLGTEIAALAIKNGQARRWSAHNERHLEEAAQETADDAQVQAMHDEASSMRTQGWVDMGAGVISAGCALALPANPVTGAASAGGTAASLSSLGVGKLVDGLFSASQHDDEASATQAKAAADRAGNAARDAADDANNASATINSALDFARSYVSIEAQTQAAALHRA